MRPERGSLLSDVGALRALTGLAISRLPLPQLAPAPAIEPLPADCVATQWETVTRAFPCVPNLVDHAGS